MVMENTAVAVVGVLAHAHIGDYIALGKLFLDGSNALLYHPVGIPGRGAAGILMGGNAEKQHPADPGVQTFLNFLTDPIRGIPPLSLQRQNRFLDVLPFHKKQGINQAVRGNPGLPHHAPQGITGPQTAGTNGKLHIKSLL